MYEAQMRNRKHEGKRGATEWAMNPLPLNINHNFTNMQPIRRNIVVVAL